MAAGDPKSRYALRHWAGPWTCCGDPCYPWVMVRQTKGHRDLNAYFRKHPYIRRSDEAEAMLLSPQQLSHILAGRRSPTPLQAVAIAQRIGGDPGAWERK